MARMRKVLCDSCESVIYAGSPFCGACQRPTVWATHRERTDWEVAQWRKARGSSSAGATVLTMPRKAPPTSAPEPITRLVPAAGTASERRRPSRPGFLARLRKLLSGSATALRGAEPARPVQERVAKVEGAPVPAATVAPPAVRPVRKAPAKPRKRPSPPTNKDMLKQAITLLTKVERRLDRLEKQMGGRTAVGE